MTASWVSGEFDKLTAATQRVNKVDKWRRRHAGEVARPSWRLHGGNQWRGTGADGEEEWFGSWAADSHLREALQRPDGRTNTVRVAPTSGGGSTLSGGCWTSGIINTCVTEVIIEFVGWRNGSRPSLTAWWGGSSKVTKPGAASRSLHYPQFITKSYMTAWSCDRSPSLASRPATASRERQRLEAASDVTTYAHRSLSFVVILELFSTLPISTAKIWP